MATIVTDKHLNILVEGPVIAIHHPQSTLDTMDEWNQRTHGESGLIARVLASQVSMRQAELQTLEFLQSWTVAGKSPMCGNSICQDRRFMVRLMPQLEIGRASFQPLSHQPETRTEPTCRSLN